MADSAYTKALAENKKELPLIDKRLYDTIWGEASGGSPAEVAAVTSVFLNRAMDKGYDKALKGSVAYNKKSPQYKKAETGDMNAFEKALYVRNKVIIDTLVKNPGLIQPYTHFENVAAYGEPKWAKSATTYKDIGRQRFYVIKE
jgi:spore germination cell wall hydrolase CwlJ-like protein